jgi:hypothetical protein
MSSWLGVVVPEMKQGRDDHRCNSGETHCASRRLDTKRARQWNICAG